jgi:phosphoglycerate dehydrogenase-like enzyme
MPGFADGDLLMTNSRETHVIPMADHVFACILAFAHCLPDQLRDQQSRTFDSEKYLTSMRELAGSTMGILAMGDIGRAVAKRAQGFDMEVYGVDIAAMDPPPGVRAVWPVSRLDEMLVIADWLVITAPLTNQTRDLIDAERLARLKPGCHVIVVSRGGIVNEEALIEGLRSGQVAGAGVDAFTTEPLLPDSPWWDLPNVIITPHTSANSPALWQRRADIAFDNIGRFLSGRPLRFVCDKQAGY